MLLQKGKTMGHSNTHNGQLWQILLATVLILYPHHSSGLTYEELVNGTEHSGPVIPDDVRMDGNVTVERSTDGMVSFYFRGLPNHPTSKVNPNDPEAAHFEIDLPENPIPQLKETCLSGGPIGWTIHGVALFNPFNHCGTNAVEGEEAEIFDNCQGHPAPDGVYHYHQFPDACVFPGNDTFVHGIARDGFPIYGPYKEDGTLVQESELDKCHGRCGSDGKYRYHMTKTYPYIMGCFRGKPVEFNYTLQMDRRPPPGSPPPPRGDIPSLQPGGRGDRPPPPPGGTGDRPPPPQCRENQTSPNQCAYNTVNGPNFDFQMCTAYAHLFNGSNMKLISHLLVGIACLVALLNVLV